MSRIEKEFTTEERALGFIQGVQYANDSAIEVIEMVARNEPHNDWIVVMEDADALEDECLL